MPWWVLTLRISGLGWYVATCIILGVLGGLWLDRRFNTLPILTLVGTVLGSVVAFYGTYRVVTEFLKLQEHWKNGKRGKS